MLNRYERRQLREIEDWFEENDPSFAEYVSTASKSATSYRRHPVVSGFVLGGVLAFVLGLFMASPGLVFIGLCLAIGGFSLSSMSRGKDEPTDDDGDG